MIVLLGASGYIGQAFAQALRERAQSFTALSRKQVDYSRFDALLEFLSRTKPKFLINCAGYTGKPNVDACENAKADTLAGNALLPLTIGAACATLDIPWGHISSGCIYTGAKIVAGDQVRTERDLTRPDPRALVAQSP